MPYQHFKVTKEQPNIGATISGIDLNNVKSEAVFAEIRQALIEFGVIFFRDQDISHDAHIDLARAIGSPEVHEFFPNIESNKEISVIAQPPNLDNSPVGNSGTDIWHADVTFRDEPSLACILRGVDIPFGGDTMWVNMHAAYNNLPQKVKEILQGLSAEHDILANPALRRFKLETTGPEGLAKLAKERPPTVHPVVIAHPISGKPVLYVNSIWTSRIIDIPEALGDAILKWLYEMPKLPEFQVRFEWQANSIAIWDNFATQHYAVNDYRGYREMQRVVVSGMRPTAYDMATPYSDALPSFIDTPSMALNSDNQKDAIKLLFA